MIDKENKTHIIIKLYTKEEDEKNNLRTRISNNNNENEDKFSYNSEKLNVGNLTESEGNFLKSKVKISEKKSCGAVSNLNNQSSTASKEKITYGEIFVNPAEFLAASDEEKENTFCTNNKNEKKTSPLLSRVYSLQQKDKRLSPTASDNNINNDAKLIHPSQKLILNSSAKAFNPRWKTVSEKNCPQFVSEASPNSTLYTGNINFMPSPNSFQQNTWTHSLDPTMNNMVFSCVNNTSIPQYTQMFNQFSPRHTEYPSFPNNKFGQPYESLPYNKMFKFKTQPVRSYLVKFVCNYDIRIANDDKFCVTKRLIGNKGYTLRKILFDSCIRFNDFTTKIRLRGKGSGYKEGVNHVGKY